MRRTLCAVLFAMAVFVPPASSQQPTQRQVDSLAAQVRQLRAKLDSLLATMGARQVPTDDDHRWVEHVDARRQHPTDRPAADHRDVVRRLLRPWPRPRRWFPSLHHGAR